MLPRYAESTPDGEGARRYGGRYNGPGTPLVYVASSLALAMLEVLVHIDRSQALGRHVALPVTFDSRDVLVLESEMLPDGWNSPVPPAAVQEIGDRWAESHDSLLLRVPSALLLPHVRESEHNYLINPLHEHFGHLEIGSPTELEFDKRLRDSP